MEKLYKVKLLDTYSQCDYKIIQSSEGKWEEINCFIDNINNTSILYRLFKNTTNNEYIWTCKLIKVDHFHVIKGLTCGIVINPNLLDEILNYTKSEIIHFIQSKLDQFLIRSLTVNKNAKAEILENYQQSYLLEGHKEEVLYKITNIGDNLPSYDIETKIIIWNRYLIGNYENIIILYAINTKEHRSLVLEKLKTLVDEWNRDKIFCELINLERTEYYYI